MKSLVLLDYLTVMQVQTGLYLLTTWLESDFLTPAPCLINLQEQLREFRVTFYSLAYWFIMKDTSHYSQMKEARYEMHKARYEKD